MRFRSLTTHDVKLMGWKDVTLLGNFLAFSNGIMIATPPDYWTMSE